MSPIQRANQLVNLNISSTENKLLTQEVVSRAKARKSEYFIRDTDLKGFWLRVQPSGTKTYGIHARYNRQGKVFKRSIGSAKKYAPKEARELARDWFTKFDAGIDPKQVNRASFNLVELLEQYIQSKNLKESTIRGYRYNFQHYLKPLKNRLIQDVTSDDIVRWYNAGTAHATGTERTFVVLKAILDYAHALDYTSEKPADKAALQLKRKKNPSKQQHLSDIYDDLPHFMAAFITTKISAVMRDWMVLNLTTGLRRHESMTLKWNQVDMQKKRVTLATNKADRFLIVPMVGLTYDMFQFRADDPCKDDVYVFTSKPNTAINDARKALAKICRAAGISTYGHHDFRRLFASVCHDIGVSESEIGNLLNHAPKTVTSVYINQSLEKARGKYQQVVDALDRKIPFDNVSRKKDKYFLTATNLMRNVFYGKIAVNPDPPITKDELEESIMRNEEYWQG